MPTKDIVISVPASTVAWYGAIVSTLAIIISATELLYKLSQDRFNVRVKINPNMVVQPDGLAPYPANTRFTTYQVINRGLRAVVITSAGFVLRRAKVGPYNHAVINTFGLEGGVGSLPKEIKGGDSYTVFALQDSIIKDLDHLVYFVVGSATGEGV